MVCSRKPGFFSTLFFFAFYRVVCLLNWLSIRWNEVKGIRKSHSLIFTVLMNYEDGFPNLLSSALSFFHAPPPLHPAKGQDLPESLSLLETTKPKAGNLNCDKVFQVRFTFVGLPTVISHACLPLGKSYVPNAGGQQPFLKSRIILDLSTIMHSF